LKYHEEEEGVGAEVTLEEEEITGEGETQEVEEEGSAVEVGEEIIEEAAAEEVEIEENIVEEAEVEEEAIIEGVGEEGHPAEEVVAIEKGRGHPMEGEEETDMRAEELLLLLPIVERETTIERKEEDHLQEMVHPEDHHLPGTAMDLLVETMGDPPLLGPPEDLMRAAGLAVEADMKMDTPVGVLLLLPGLTDTGAEALWPAEIPHHMQVAQEQEKGILQVQATRALAEALEQVEEITEGEDLVMGVEDIRIMKEVTTGGIAEEAMSHPQEPLLEMTILHQGVKEEDLMKEGKEEVLQDIIVKSDVKEFEQQLKLSGHKKVFYC